MLADCRKREGGHLDAIRPEMLTDTISRHQATDYQHSEPVISRPAYGVQRPVPDTHRSADEEMVIRQSEGHEQVPLAPRRSYRQHGQLTAPVTGVGKDR